MKLCVISDSHGQTEEIRRVAEREAGCDAFIHLGDVGPDAEYLRSVTDKPVYAVRGNCDLFYRDAPDELVETFSGVTVLMCHGHRYSVKAGVMRLFLRSQEAGARVALFGHTHGMYKCDEDGVLLLNPGALCDGRYALLTLEGGKVAGVEHRRV